MDEAQDITPWSTAAPYATGFPSWVAEEDQQRLQAYQVYHNLYWSEEDATPVIRRNDDGSPIYLPKPKTIVDTTAHFLLKGLTIELEGADKAQTEYFEAFMARENFLSKFNVAKLKGVALGDWYLHITADPDLPEGSRISVTTVDPSAVFPEYDDEDDPDRVTGIKIVEPWDDPENPVKTLVKILRYSYEDDGTVWRQEDLWEIEGWNNPDKAKKRKSLLTPAPLPPEIKIIPIYHWKNAEWDGNLFGNSELKGVERLFQGLNQALSDEEIALALVGLGVYATDAGRPVRDGREVDWVISPGTVLEVPGATMIKKIDGISSVTPVQDHLSYLGDVLMESTQTSDVALGRVEKDVAESGIALAIKFLPTQAKLEYRDQEGLGVLVQFWYDMKAWFKAYDQVDFSAVNILCKLGDKLPVNRAKVIEELNNLFDRDIISAEYYREQLTDKLGFVFPANEAQRVLDEKVAALEATQKVMQEHSQDGEGSTVEDENQSNNKNKVNESNGTEVENDS